MQHRLSRQIIAEYTLFPTEVSLVVHTILARLPDMCSTLASNPTVLSPVWRQLWGSKRPDAGLAKLLVSRELSKPDRELVLKRESRAKVLAALLTHNILDRGEQEKVAEVASSSLATTLLEQPWLVPDLRKEIAVRAGGISLLEELTLAPSGRFSDDEIVELLTSFHEWGPTNHFRERSAQLKLLFSRRPGVIDAVLAISWPAEASFAADVLRTAVAGCSHLTVTQAELLGGVVDGVCTLDKAARDRCRYLLLALVANPSTPLAVVSAVKQVAELSSEHELRVACDRRANRTYVPGPYYQVGDPSTLDWLIGRACPSSYGSAPRIMELVELAQNPHLSAEQAAWVLVSVDQYVPNEIMREHRSVLESLLPRSAAWDQPNASPPSPGRFRGWPEPVLDLAAQRLGTNASAWETLLGLLHEFEGSFEDLIELSVQI